MLADSFEAERRKLLMEIPELEGIENDLNVVGSGHPSIEEIKRAVRSAKDQIMDAYDCYSALVNEARRYSCSLVDAAGGSPGNFGIREPKAGQTRNDILKQDMRALVAGQVRVYAQTVNDKGGKPHRDVRCESATWSAMDEKESKSTENLKKTARAYGENLKKGIWDQASNRISNEFDRDGRKLIGTFDMPPYNCDQNEIEELAINLMHEIEGVDTDKITAIEVYEHVTDQAGKIKASKWQQVPNPKSGNQQGGQQGSSQPAQMAGKPEVVVVVSYLIDDVDDGLVVVDDGCDGRLATAEPTRVDRNRITRVFIKHAFVLRLIGVSVTSNEGAWTVLDEDGFFNFVPKMTERGAGHQNVVHFRRKANEVRFDPFERIPSGTITIRPIFVERDIFKKEYREYAMRACDKCVRWNRKTKRCSLPGPHEAGITCEQYEPTGIVSCSNCGNYNKKTCTLGNGTCDRFWLGRDKYNDLGLKWTRGNDKGKEKDNPRFRIQSAFKRLYSEVDNRINAIR